MLQYEITDASERIDVDETSLSKECMRCHYWYFKDVGFKFEEHVCKRCHNLLTTVYGLQNTAKLSATFNRNYF